MLLRPRLLPLLLRPTRPLPLLLPPLLPLVQPPPSLLSNNRCCAS